MKRVKIGVSEHFLENAWRGEGGGIFPTLCVKFCLVLALFLLREMVQIWGFWSCSVDFPHYGAPLTQTGHIWGFWALSGEHVGVMLRGSRGIFPTVCVEFCLVVKRPLISGLMLSETILCQLFHVSFSFQVSERLTCKFVSTLCLFLWYDQLTRILHTLQ